MDRRHKSCVTATNTEDYRKMLNVKPFSMESSHLWFSAKHGFFSFWNEHFFPQFSIICNKSFYLKMLNIFKTNTSMYWSIWNSDAQDWVPPRSPLTVENKKYGIFINKKKPGVVVSNKYIIIRKKYGILDVNVLHCVFDYCLPSCGGRGVIHQVILKKKIIF